MAELLEKVNKVIKNNWHSCVQPSASMGNASPCISKNINLILLKFT